MLRGVPLRTHCIFGCRLSSSLRILWTKRAPLVDSKILRIRVTLQMSVPRLRAKGNFLRMLCPDICCWGTSLLLKLHLLSWERGAHAPDDVAPAEYMGKTWLCKH